MSGLLEIVASEQTRLRGKFGDPDLFLWLARPGNHGIWKTAVDPVNILATRNATQSLVERSQAMATMTLPDAIEHPRFVQWEPPGGSNLRHCTPSVDATGTVSVSLELLSPQAEVRFKEAAFSVPFAPSGLMIQK